VKVEDLPCMKTPCKDCPMRKDSLKGWLGSVRIKEILDSESFVCHKKNDLQCAGHMILRGSNNIFFRVAKYTFGNAFKLSGKELIFNSTEECINHHSN
jgi:hypothetical protein